MIQNFLSSFRDILLSFQKIYIKYAHSKHSKFNKAYFVAYEIAALVLPTSIGAGTILDGS